MDLNPLHLEINDVYLFEEFYEMVPDLFIITEGFNFEDRKIIKFNSAFVNKLGYTSDELIGMNFFDLISDDLNRFDQAVQSYQQNGFIQDVRYNIRKKNGSLIPLLVTAVIVEKNPCFKIIGILKDITHLVKIRQALEQSSDNLKVMIQLLAHDLKAPLYAIQNLSSWILEDDQDNLSTESIQHLNAIQRRVERTNNLIKDISNYLLCPALEQIKQKVCVENLIASTLETQWLPKGFKITCDVEVQEFVTTKVLLSQVIANLISNAIKHHHQQQDGRLHIHGYADHHTMTLEFQDNGPGIPKDAHTKIFQILTTLRSKDQVEGSGVGLALVDKIIKMVGGKISVKPNKKQGTIFTVNWPLKTI